MKERFENFAVRLSSSVHHPMALRLFTKAVYGWFLVNVLLTLSDRDYIWGEKTVLLRYGAGDNRLNNLIHILMYDLSLFSPAYYLHIVSAILGMTDRWWTFFPRTITWITGLMIFFAGIPALNSGMLIMLLLAFYCIPAYTGATHPYRIVLTNFSYFTSFFQIVLCYLFSVIFKLTGHIWIEGSAVYYALSIDRFSIPWIQQPMILGNQWLMKFLNYAALGYQMIFPIVIWFKRKNILLITGILFHLFICVVMHLWDFGLAMIFCYTLFLREDQIGYWARRLSFKNAKRGEQELY